jgi:predicted GH43/DUF377 family glycosyl hydrolase
MTRREPRITALLFICLWSGSPGLHSQALWYKFVNNPVMVHSGTPGAFDDMGVLAPAMVRKDSIYRMWYTGYSADTRKYSIGFAYSVDGITWEKNGPQAVLKENPVNPFESDWVWASCAVIVDNGYLLYYSGFDGSVMKLAVAFSRNGVEWERAPENPILPTGLPGSWDEKDTYAASVVKLGPGDYRMWYSAQNRNIEAQIGLATSADGIHWVKYAQNPVLKLGPAGSWEDHLVYSPRVVFVDNKFHMFYLGSGGYGGPHIGYAYSTDGINWKKYGLNPVLTAGGVTSDGSQLIDPAVLYEEGAYRMWYGIYRWNAWAIGYAISEPLPVAVGDSAVGAPSGFALHDAYPNPFNPTTTIGYTLSSSASVSLTVFNALGEQVATLVEGDQLAGRHEVMFTASGLSSGIYFYRLMAGSFVETKKLVVTQ